MVDLSVCVISYNQAKYIEQCLGSIVSQKTSYNIEVIFSDDCSQDDTVARAERILERSKLPYTINVMKKNSGFQKNLRKALSICKGRYVALCEADDYWLDDSRLDKQVEVLDANAELAFCFSAAKSINDGGEDLGDMRPHTGDKLYTPHELVGKSSSLCPTFTIVFRNSFFKKITDEIYNQPVFDYPLQILLAVQGPAYYFDEFFGVYRRNSLGSWSASGASSSALLSRYRRSRDMHAFLLRSVDATYKRHLNITFFKGCLVFLRRNNIKFSQKLGELRRDRGRFGILYPLSYCALMFFTLKILLFKDGGK